MTLIVVTQGSLFREAQLTDGVTELLDNCLPATFLLECSQQEPWGQEPCLSVTLERRWLSSVSGTSQAPTQL